MLCESRTGYLASHYLLWQLYKVHSSCWYRLAKRFWWIYKSFKSCPFIGMFPFEPRILHNRWQSLNKSGICTHIIWKRYWCLWDTLEKERSASKFLAMETAERSRNRAHDEVLRQKIFCISIEQSMQKKVISFQLFHCCRQYMLMNCLTQEKLILLLNKTL